MWHCNYDLYDVKFAIQVMDKNFTTDVEMKPVSVTNASLTSFL